MIVQTTLGALAAASFGLTLWQWLVARRFPLHAPNSNLHPKATGLKPNLPAVTLLKPLKDADEYTEACLRSWFQQEYAGEIQILFGAESPSDPACALVSKLLAEFPRCDASLVICAEPIGANAKVAKLAQLEPLAKHEVLVVSDADVRVPPCLLTYVVPALATADEKSPLGSGDQRIAGLVNCFYRLAHPTTPAMSWEAVAINADFWSQVLQSRSLRPLDFALGAVMAMRRQRLAEVGGFRALADCAADDYQLGHRIARQGYRIEICSIVVECWSAPMNWRSVWRHQLRWARTIRVCKPLPYFLSILSNATLWPLLWLVANASVWHGDAYETPLAVSIAISGALILFRGLTALDLERRLTQRPFDLRRLGLVPLKDLLHVAIWVMAFLGDQIEWRGERYQLQRDGTMEKQ